MGELAAEVGAVSAIGVHHVCQRAGMSRRTFYDLYEQRDDCFMDALAGAYGRLEAQIEEAAAAAGPVWEDRAVAVARALVGTLAADCVLAHLCVVAALSDGRDAARLRSTTHDRIVALLADAPDLGFPGEPVLAGALGAVWELAHQRLIADRHGSLADLGEVAVYLLLAPFVGRRHATALAGRAGETALVTRWTPTIAGADQCGVTITELTRQTLTYLDANPGARNIDIAHGVDVRHESQISRHLVRLERAGLVCRRKEGRTNAWQLTTRGQEAARSLRDTQPPPSRLTISAWASANRNEA
jgi:AcrR family transcriptional regulator